MARPAPRILIGADCIAPGEVIVATIIAFTVLTVDGLTVRYWATDNADPADLAAIGNGIAQQETAT